MTTRFKPFERLRGLFRSGSPDQDSPAIGAVVYRRSGGRLSILIFKDKKGYWSVPRAQPQGSEPAEETIIRTIGEQVGPLELKIWQSLGQFGLADPKRPKKKPLILQLFLIQAVVDSDHPLNVDSKDAIWLPVAEAAEKIDYEEVVRIISLAAAKIKRAQI